MIDRLPSGNHAIFFHRIQRICNTHSDNSGLMQSKTNSTTNTMLDYYNILDKTGVGISAFQIEHIYL